MDRELLFKVVIKGTRVQIFWDPYNYLIVIGWGKPHWNLDDWYPRLRELAIQRDTQQVIVIAPDRPEVTKEFYERAKRHELECVWLGLNKLPAKKPNGETVVVFVNDLLTTFDSAYAARQLIETERALEVRRLRVASQIRDEEAPFKRYPVVCEVHEATIIAPENQHGPRAHEFFGTMFWKTRGNIVPLIACFTESLKQGLLISEKVAVPIVVAQKQANGLTVAALEGMYWTNGSAFAVYQEKSKLPTFLFLRHRTDWVHPQIDPTNPIFTPIIERFNQNPLE